MHIQFAELPVFDQERAKAFYIDHLNCRVVTDDRPLTAARLQLCLAARTTIGNALGLMGVSAPDRM